MFRSYRLKPSITCCAFSLLSLFVTAQDSLQQFKDPSGKTGFKNKSGAVIIPAKYDEVNGFYKGYAGVKLNSKWGIIDQKGNPVVPIKYDELGYSFLQSFDDGLIR